MEPLEYVGKTYRIQITDPEIDFLCCLPAIKETHQETTIPKNSIVKIVEYHLFFEANWYEIDYNYKLYWVTEAQVKDFFIPVHVRSGHGRAANRR